jgi:tRNA (mo5U34)-methyltransferase
VEQPIHGSRVVTSRFFRRLKRPARTSLEPTACDGLVGPVEGFSREELRQRIARCQWAHTIDLEDGTTTPGFWAVETQADIRRAFDDIDFSGKKVLDIGCWDGLWSFEAERRGAALVYATDAPDQRPHTEHPTVILARAYLNSRIRYYQRLRVERLLELGVFDFDVVIFAGVYYHLKDPLLALARIRRVMKDGGVLLVEGAVIDSPECFASFHYRDHYAGDPSNWWVPTVPCLKQWIECSCFELDREYPSTIGAARRVLTARAVRRHDVNYLYDDEEVQPYLLKP